jgi:hypothetical protein
MRTIKIISIVGLCALLNACGGGGASPSGGGTSGAPSGQGSSPTGNGPACLNDHPEMQVTSFASMAAAVGAFARAVRDCAATENEARAIANKLYSRGVRIEGV